MPNKIEIKLLPFVVQSVKPLVIAKRAHQILAGDMHGPWRQKSGYQWQLDASNDYWMSIEGDTLILACRYNEKVLHALGILMQHQFGKLDL